MKKGEEDNKNSSEILGIFEGYKKLRFRIGLSIVIIFLFLIAMVSYSIFFKVSRCDNSICFSDAMQKCKKVSWIKEDSQASWIYAIKNEFDSESCKVEVVLFKMKEGSLDSEKLEGKEMVCILKKGETQFPENDVSKCSGRLKEELQDIIIQRLHNYILKNIGEINEEII